MVATNVWWVGNQASIAQVDSLTITATALNGWVQAVINGKAVRYTSTGTDTVNSVAANFQSLLSSQNAPEEFGEITFTVNGAVITCTASTPGTPFTMTTVDALGSAVVQAHLTANSSPNDVYDPQNWIRGSSFGLPQAGDFVILQNSSVSLLWNLDQFYLNGITFASFTRWQSFTGTVGLNEYNPNGYYEYRQTYLQFVGPTLGTAINVVLGLGGGTGPTRERYDCPGQRINLYVLASGQPADAYAIRIKDTQGSSVFSVIGTSLGVAMLPGDTASLASATLDGGGSIAMGSGVTLSGTVTINAGTGVFYCAATISAANNSNVTVAGIGLTYPTITGTGNSTFTWLSDSTITTLTLASGSVLDKSQDIRPMTITNSTIEGDTCTINDPTSAITYTNPTNVTGQVSQGPFQFSGPRTVKIV